MLGPHLACFSYKNNRTDLITRCGNATRCWKGSFRMPGGIVQYQRGCFEDENQVAINCNHGRWNDKVYRHIECCSENYCNQGDFPVLEPLGDGMVKGAATSPGYIYFLVAVIILIIIFSIASAVDSRVRKWFADYFRDVCCGDNAERRRRRAQRRSRPAVPTRTVPRMSEQLTLDTNIGSFGSYELWRGTHQRIDQVMVKIYSPASKSLWTHEIQVYTKLIASKPKYILPYAGNDTVGLGREKRMWIVTAYEPNGSLVDYLKATRLDVNGMIKAMFGLVCGLKQLHNIPMAHRNLNSRIVYVKGNGECIIGGLEHSVMKRRLDQDDFFEYASKRYLSPELLEPGFTYGELSTFQKADMYNLALIFWEICRMCHHEGIADLDYSPPFAEWLENEEEPTIEKIREIVLVDGRRPGFPDFWDNIPVMFMLKSLIEECWDEYPEDRPSTFRVREILRIVPFGYNYLTDNFDLEIP